MTLSCTSSEGDFSHFSQQEEEEEEEEDEVSYEDHAVMEEHGVAVARPPRSAATSAEVVVSGQAALDILEQLQSSGHVGRERASNLRRRYLLLKDTLESSRTTETALLTQAKQLGQVLTQQQRVLEKGEAFPEGDSGELVRLRQILLAHSNQLEQTLQRLNALNTQLASVEEEHGQMSRELDRLPCQADVEATLAGLNQQLDDLRDEIRKRSKDIQQYTTEVENREKRLSSILHDTEELKTRGEALQDELVQIRSAPGNLPREIDSIRKRQKDTRQQVTESEYHLDHLSAQLQELQSHCKALEGELREAGERLGEAQEEGNRLHDLEGQADSSLAQAKERQVALLEQQASLELAMRHRNTEYGRLYEASAALARDNDRIVKQLKKAALLFDTAKQAEVQLQQRAGRLQTQVDEGELAAKERQRRQQEIREEVESLRDGLSMQDGVSSAQRAVLEERQREEERVRARVASLTTRLQQLSKEAVALIRQRDRDSRTCHQAKLSELSTQASLCTQDAQLREQKKTLSHLQQQLSDFAEAYKLIKTERNHTHSLIHKLQQLGSEMREKWRVLQNEVEVLTTSAQDKEKLLQKCSLVHSTKCTERDSQRQVAGKLSLEAAQTSAELEAQRETLAKLTHEVSSLENQLNQLRKNYEHALQERNDAGLQLIERNEEVCVFHERLNMQEAELRKAGLDLMARAEEIRYLQLEVAQLQTHILVSRKSFPERSRLQAELDSAQIQLCACEEELCNLEKRVENAEDPARVRLLPGPQESQNELWGHLESLESKLASQEQAGLEKELLYEQVCRLAERAKARASTHRESTLQVAQHVNQYQSKIKDTTHKTMALVSELTMQQANALHLRHEAREREAAVERAYLRLQAGQPPDEETEQQWQQLLRVDQQRRQASVTRKLEVEVSTVEPRPNAYLPTGEGDLPVPKPYGNHAPFKPSQPGANMRHIRKPEPKPIDI